MIYNSDCKERERDGFCLELKAQCQDYDAGFCPFQDSAEPQNETDPYHSMATKITAVCDSIKGMLLEKNRSYGNSAAAPMRIFSKASALEAINIRIDDKLNRIAKGQEYGQEDTELDLIGYLILKRCLTNP